MIPKLDMMGEEDWIETPQHEVDTSFVSCVINDFDESALEMGLRIKDKTETKLTALTIGQQVSFIKNLYALKYDEVIRIESKTDIRFYSEIVANVISSYICKEGTDQDLIIMGSQNGEGDNSKTPLLLAEMLGIPCITEVLSIELDSEEGTLVIQSLCDDGVKTQRVKTPCVVAIGNAPKCYLRVPTLADKMKYKKKEVSVYSIEDFNLGHIIEETHNDYKLIHLEKHNSKRQAMMIEGENMSRKVDLLFKEHLIGRLK
jgi:electron transfer flavoprotein alpha/beta subunit